ncbi:hypothetical protein [Cellulomonas terrae]|uniref:HPr kinase n=1 Tax=Cellulomonas terrae TaxID=311234 RepID=A0A511JK24_9CELL|nr:hypothetical protein [Cellulomonas terrae]GEL98360.1 hypothetical protein CTE05_19070 [Cellulomonas terrae]
MSTGLLHEVLRVVDGAAAHRVRAGFGPHTVVVAANTPQHLAWLEQYTAPQYRFDEAPEDEPAQLVSHEDPSFTASVRRALDALPGRRATVYQSYPVHEVDLGDGWLAWSHVDRPSVILARPGDRCVTLGSPADPESKAEPIRCLREMFTKNVERDGHLVFHTGAVVVDGHGLVFCGEKGAGKSTTVISLLEAGAEYLSNDRSYVGRSQDGAWTALPWPTTAAIGMGTLYHFPQLRTWMERGGGWGYEPQTRLGPDARHELLRTRSPGELAAMPDKLELTAEELAGSLGARVAPHAALSCVVLPRLDLGCDEPEVRPATRQEAAAVLRSQCFTPSDDHYPDWLRWRTASEMDLRRAADDLVDRLVHEVPLATMRFGDLRGERGRRALDLLLELASPVPVP